MKRRAFLTLLGGAQPGRQPRPGLLGGLVLAIAVSAFAAAAQTASDSRAVRIVVPSSAGGGADVLARMIADHAGRVHGRTFVVENRPGGGNTIGTEAVARSAPDGATILMTTPEFVINSHLRSLSYFDLWFGTAAPAGTSRDAIGKLAALFRQTLADPGIVSNLKSQGLFAVGSCEVDHAAFTRSQFEAYGRAIKEAGMALK